MVDEEFKKKLNSVLENLYKIDREVRESIEKERCQQKSQETEEKEKSPPSPLERVIKNEQKKPP